MAVLLIVPGCEPPRDATSPDADLPLNTRERIEGVAEWRLADTADVSLGVVEGEPAEELFGVITDASLGPEGIYVLDLGNREVRVFDRDGGHLRSMGGEGEGPGDFDFPTEFTVSGDDAMVSVWDRRLRRLTAFGSDGTVDRMATIERNLLNPELQAVLPDGSFLLAEGTPSYPGEDGTAVTAVRAITKYSRAGELLDTLAQLTGSTLFLLDGVLLGKPFASADLMASAGDGMWVLDGDTALAVRLGPSGDTLQTVEWEPPDREVTRADLDAYVDGFLESVSDEERRGAIEQLRDPTLAATRHSAAVELMSDWAGRLWLVERHDYARLDARRWLVFDRDGRVTARLREPDGDLLLLDADETHALVQTTDALGVQRVELRRIVEGG